MNGHKILPQHLERQAYVYVRQSSPRQVEEHLESQDLQYQLVHRAQALGWAESQVVVIDDDLGKSVRHPAQRRRRRLRPPHLRRPPAPRPEGHLLRGAVVHHAHPAVRRPAE
jgi:hypothetical protein